MKGNLFSSIISWNRFVILSKNIALIDDLIHNKIKLDIKDNPACKEATEKFVEAVKEYEKITKQKIYVNMVKEN